MSPCLVHQWLHVVYQDPAWVCLFLLCGALSSIASSCVMPVCHRLSSVHPWLDEFGAYMGHGFCVLVAGVPFCVLFRIAWMCLWAAGCSCVFSMLFTTGDIPMLCLDVFVAYVLCFMVSAQLSEGVCCTLSLMWTGSLCIVCFLYFP